MNVYVSHAGASTRGGGHRKLFLLVGFSSLSTKIKREKKRERKKRRKEKKGAFQRKGALFNFKCITIWKIERGEKKSRQIKNNMGYLRFTLYKEYTRIYKG